MGPRYYLAACPEGQHVADAAQQAFHSERLGEQVEALVGHEALDQVGVMEAGHEQYVQIRLFRAELFGYHGTGEIRHDHVGQQQMHRASGAIENLDGAAAAIGEQNAITGALQHSLHQAEDGAVVVHREDGSSARFPSHNFIIGIRGLEFETQ